ncbi:MAG: chemotaxis protein CheW [Desulfobulbales bacterium]|nr:chemotaxis protein CheW [Desulfobulbales bacterium]
MAETARQSSDYLEPDNDLYDDEDTQKDKYLTFQIAREQYGIEICHITEIIGIQTITELPEMPDFIKGVINLRGRVVPAMDVRARFNLPHREYDARTCIIVVEINATSVGLIVDQVMEVIDIPAESIEPPPKAAAKNGSNFLQGVGKVENEVKIILNVSRLLFDKELEELRKAA